MTHLRTALAAALLVFGVTSAAMAQRPRAAMAARALRRADAHLLKGIQLGDAERSNVKAVRQKFNTQLKALRAEYKPQLAGLRGARQRGDTAALRGFRQTVLKAREQAAALRRSERGDLRSALAAEHQATFDANVAAVQRRMAKRGKPVNP